MTTPANRYHFSSDWFTHHIPAWEQHLAHLRGRSDLRYLEIGVYEGRSFSRLAVYARHVHTDR